MLFLFDECRQPADRQQTRVAFQFTFSYRKKNVWDCAWTQVENQKRNFSAMKRTDLISGFCCLVTPKKKKNQKRSTQFVTTTGKKKPRLMVILITIPLRIILFWNFIMPLTYQATVTKNSCTKRQQWLSIGFFNYWNPNDYDMDQIPDSHYLWVGFFANRYDAPSLWLTYQCDFHIGRLHPYHDQFCLLCDF